MIETHPVQSSSLNFGVVPKVITMQAYEVYKHLYGRQEALVTGGCRGGFGVGELLALLYAYPFPKSEWSARFNEGLTGMKLK